MQTEINRLRLRFVAIVAVIVTVVLSMVFGSLLGLTSLALRSTSESYLEDLVAREENVSPLIQTMKQRRNSVQMPYLVVDITELESEESGEEVAEKYAIIRNFGGFYDISDTDSIEKVVNSAMNMNSEEGYLSEYGLRFMKAEQTNGETTIAFVDVSSQISAMDKIERMSFFIGIMGILSFTVIAIILSKWMVHPIENAWNQQKEFISNASHELKTPLTVITINAEMLQGPDVDAADRNKYTGNIVTVSHQMRNLVEDLLNLSRLEKEESAVYEKINMSDCINDALMQFEPVMFGLGLNLKEDVQPDIFVKGNTQRLGQLVTILLDNAGKYSLPGDVCVELTNQGKNAQLIVRNPAEEMTEEQLKKIFSRFYRVDESHNEKGSYGLGLSIAQKICETHKGKIRAEYKDGNICFVATIPLA